MTQSNEERINRLLTHQVDGVIVRESLEKKLRSGKKLRIKLGADPSRPDLHLGHAVVLRKLREFQDLGHQVVFVIGDFTGLIGDPSGKSKTRPMLTPAEIKKNAKTYFQQVGKILDTKKCEVRFNSEWLGKMKAADFIALAAKFTVARILERDDFAKRLREHADIHVHELLYPMLQAQDSIALEADVEIGATDQTFNMLAGRDLARRLDQPEQDVITCRILVGTDGVHKMSKSLDNYISLADSPDTMFGKTMSIPDGGALINWIELAADYSREEIEKEICALGQENPRNVKMRLAKRIVALYHGQHVAGQAEETFVERFQRRQMPKEEKIDKFYFGKMFYGTDRQSVKLYELVAACFGISNSQARRDIESGGVKINGDIAKDSMMEISKPGFVIQKGKLNFRKVI